MEIQKYWSNPIIFGFFRRSNTGMDFWSFGSGCVKRRAKLEIVEKFLRKVLLFPEHGFRHTIVSSILTDLIFRRNHRRRAVSSEPSLNRRRSWDRATRFKTQNRHNNSINSNINLDLGFSDFKDKITAPNPLNRRINSLPVVYPNGDAWCMNSLEHL